jgi:queuosine precursor transporter
MLIALYLTAIVVANLSVVAFGPSVAIVNAFAFIALDLTARDRLHEAWQGRGLIGKMGALIAAGSLLSYALNVNAGPIALASFVAFAASASLDSLCYSLLHERAYLVKVNGSNIVSAAADSLIFPALAFGLPLLWWIVVGQFVAKVVGGALWAWVLQPRKVPA